MVMSNVKNRKILIINAAFLLLAVIAVVFYYFEAKDTLQLVKSERGRSIEFTQLARSTKDIHRIQFSDIIADWQNYIIVDVREREEFSEGRIKGSLNYRLGELLSNAQARRDMVRKTMGKKRVFFCYDGDRSMLAASTIQDEFDGPNYVLEGGFRQIQGSETFREVWEGTTDRLPGGMNYERTPWLKWKDARVNVLIDLTLKNKPPVVQYKGKTILHAPILLMSDAQIDAFINTLGAEPIVAVCNSKVSCFSTRIFRYRLEEKGLKLSGFIRLKENQTIY